MAESVDAPVSKTGGGDSVPVRVRLWARLWAAFRVIIWVFVGLLAVWVVFLLGLDRLLRTEAGQRFARRAVVNLLATALDTDVELQRLRLSGLAHLTLEGFTIYDKGCERFLRAKAIKVGWTPLSFWQGFWRGKLHIPLSSVSLTDPQVYIYTERASGLTNVDRLFPPDTSASDEPSPWRISVPKIRLEGGSFRWCDSTAADSALQPTPGYLNYAHLHMDSLFLSASVEVLPRGRLFAQIHHLQLVEKNAHVPLPHLALTLKAHPDSTVIPFLEIRLPRSYLQGEGKFFQEGLDKLFANTDSKTFSAQLRGLLDWKELYAFIGDSIPIRGQWEVQLDLLGDLVRLQATDLQVRLAPGRYIYASGEVVHYARPKKIHWKATIKEAALSLADVQNTIDGLALPEELEDSTVWQFSARHEGSLRGYQFALRAAGLAFEGGIFREDTVQPWRYEAQAAFETWEPQRLIRAFPLSALTGTLLVEGEGFALETLHAELAADLKARYDTVGLLRVACKGALADGRFEGKGFLVTPYGTLSYGGAIPLREGIPYLGSGRVEGLRADLWGGRGTLSANLHLAGNGFPWAAGEAQLDIDSLYWRQSDTLYGLGRLSLTAQEGHRYSAVGRGLRLSLVSTGAWTQGLASWIKSWERGFQQGTWAAPDTLPAWSCVTQLRLQSPFWIALSGLPVELHNMELELSLHQPSEQALTGKLHLRWDSLDWTFLHADAATLQLTLTHDTLPHWQIDFRSDSGAAYLPYHKLALQLSGTPQQGSCYTFTHLASSDTLALHLRWLWPTPQAPVAVFLDTPRSYLTLGGSAWEFSMASPLYWDLNGYWQVEDLRMASSNASAFLSRDSTKLEVEIRRLPIGEVLQVLGYDIDLHGLLKLSWRSTQSTPDRFLVEVDSLAYAGEPYPQIQAAGEAQGDTLPFTLSLREGETEYLRARGTYALTDTLAPLWAELRSVQIPARWLGPFLGEYIANPKGRFRAQRILITGRPENPQFQGDLLCDRIAFYVPFVRVQYALEGVLRLRGDSLYLPDVELYETHGKKALLSGYVAMRGWQSPFLSVRMRLVDRPFLLSAAPPSADAYLYGRAELEEGTLSLTGPWNQPELRGEVRFAESTDLVLPLQTYERSSSTPHLRFVGKADSTPVAARTVTAPTGVEARIALRSVPRARFQLLFDERTGDRIVAQGTSNLLLTLTPTGEVRLSGSYEIQGGEYRINLQGAVAKKLLLEPGSTLTWDGDLYEGQMRIIATYRTFTSLRMIDSTFTYTVPVELRVFLEGPLLSPVMRFQIDIPSFSGGATPLVNLFLQRLSSDEQERNRQVFAILVLGTFIPLEQGVGSQQVSSGVSSTLAEFLSAQLASWIGQTLGNQLGVSFMLGQWNELSAQLRLSLGQRLTLERDGVVVGPGQNTPALGNLSARYRLLPKRLTQPTQWQLEAEGFSRQTFLMGVPGTSTQGAGIRLRKSFYLPERRRKSPVPQKSVP